MGVLRIQHLGGDGQPQFQLVRISDGKATPAAGVPSPVGFPVPGRPNSDLRRELRWYLEHFLEYPFPPETDRADRVLAALRDWGRQAFDAIFNTRQAGSFLRDAQDGQDYHRLRLQIASDDPAVLAWPWEALEDKHTGRLAMTCQIERRLNQIADPPPLDPRLPRDRVSILLVTARPYEQDVRYRSISRPLVELIGSRGLPAHVTMLRPPTFKQLQRHLAERPHTYHVLHFDGHGGYGAEDEHIHYHGGGACFRTKGVLVFEGPDGKPHEISAEQLSDLLREHAVPAVVLNACQSAMIDERAGDPFASVAAGLLRSGMRSVVAMAYSLYVSAAREFVPAFYEQLFATGDPAQAVRAGRRQMLAQPKRICTRGTYPLEDWLVPVLYQQDPLDFSFAAEAARPVTTEPRESNLPEEARDDRNPYGFIGRDGPLLELERAMLRPPAGILIQGLGGVGKTTLARGFVEWLEKTGGLGAGCLWFTFSDIRSAEFVINRTGEALFGTAFAAAEMDQKIDALAATLRDNRLVIVWDNFESARGIPGTSVTSNLTEDDCDLLRDFLSRLRGGETKVLITSRSDEQWLGYENCWQLPLRGLDGEERWEFCVAVLGDLGITPERDEPEMCELMELLGGHPLAMRAILPRLRDRTPAQLADALRRNLDELDLPEDEVSDKLAATLRFVEDALPLEQRPVLIPLSLHEGYVDTDLLEGMAGRADPTITRAVIDAACESLATAGLLRRVSGPIFEMHPALTGYLRARMGSADLPNRNDWRRAFVALLGNLADHYATRKLHEQRLVFHVHWANFHHALAEAEQLEDGTNTAALLQSLAAYAQNIRDFPAAHRAIERLVSVYQVAGNQEGQASAYHHLGINAQEQRDFAAAERWYRKSLEIDERQRNEHGAAMTYHQLGMIAQKQGDFAAAEHWYRKALEIKEKLGNKHSAATTYNQLGNIMQGQGDFAAAEHWYRKSLEIKEESGDEHGAASTYHNLGVMAYRQRDFAAAERWYRKSLELKRKLGNEHGAASTYHQLGMIAQEQRDFDTAEQWYRNALETWERLQNEHAAAGTCAQLGLLTRLQGDFETSGRWLIKAIVNFVRRNDPDGAASAVQEYRITYSSATIEVQARLQELCQQAGISDLTREGGDTPPGGE